MMGKVSLRELGKFGLLADRPGFEVPPEFFTSLRNVAGARDGLGPVHGELAVEGTPSIAPYYLFPAPAENDFYWAYCNATNVYAVAAGVHTDITRLSGDYTGALTDRWNGGWLNGVLVLNNGVDKPQGWGPIEAATPLVDLPNWPANTYAKVLRPFQEFMIAMDMTISNVRYKTRVRWSHPADPGSFPSSWDVSVATNLAGELSLSETGGEIIDGCALGNSFVVYKSDAIIRLDRVNNSFIFNRRPVSHQIGLLAQECVKEFSPGKQIFVSRDLNIYVTNGQSVQSIAEDRVRKFFISHLNPTQQDKCFVVVDHLKGEAWVCFPEVGSTWCNRALVWNFEANSWGYRDLTPTADIKSGVFTPNAVSRLWSSMTTTWDTDTTRWSDTSQAQGRYKLLGAFPTQTKLAEVGAEGTLTFLDGSAIRSSMEKRGMALVGTDRLGNIKVDPMVVKFISSMYPVFAEGSRGLVEITWGAQDTPQGGVSWGETFTVEVTELEKIHPDVEGKYLALRIESSEGPRWIFHGWSMEVLNVGNL